MKLLIADDHNLFCDILKSYFQQLEKEYEIDFAKDLPTAFKYIKKADGDYDLVILDLCMPGMNGFDGLCKTKENWPHLKVAIISGVAQPWEVGQSIENGASGFFPKSMSGKSLIHAVELVASGEKFVPIEYLAPPVHTPPAPGHPLGRADAPEHHYKLPPRENDVLKYLIRGSSNQVIADGLGLKVVTVKLHVRSICRKLGARNRTQAALYAREQNIVRI